MWAELLGFLSFFVILGGIFTLCSEHKIMGFLIVIIGGLIAAECSSNPAIQEGYKKKQARERAEEEACRKPQLVSEVDGVRLYKVREHCNDGHPVYFSKSGVQQSWRECTGDEANYCRTVTRVTPNAE